MKRLSCVLLALLATAACTDDSGSGDDDGEGSGSGSGSGSDNPNACDPKTVLPTQYRPIANVATTAVVLETTAGITTGSIDATAGGLSAAADNPYIYVDLLHAAKVDVNDLTARESNTWDIALKRSSLLTNGGDSGGGGRTLAVVDGATSVSTVTAPTDGYTEDDYTSDDCEFVSIPGGEPMSAFGEWYDYNLDTHAVTPRSQVYVLERSDKTRSALRITNYYGDPSSPMKGAFYKVEIKQLANAN